MAETENFESYTNRVLSRNNLLAGTENYLPKPILHDTIENHLAEYLSLKIDSLPSSKHEHMVQIENLNDWLIFMRQLNDSACAELQHYKNLTMRKRGNDENQAVLYSAPPIRKDSEDSPSSPRSLRTVRVESEQSMWSPRTVLGQSEALFQKIKTLPLSKGVTLQKKKT